MRQAKAGGLESGGLESGGLESRATDFGSDHAHSGGLESGGLESGSLESGGLESRATDFGSGIPHTCRCRSIMKNSNCTSCLGNNKNNNN